MFNTINQLKAKFNGGNLDNVQTASTPINFIDRALEATKTAAITTGTYMKEVAPATNRRVDSIAAQLNAELNNHDKELFKHRVMIEMMALNTGTNLPDDATLDSYYEAELKEKAEQKAKKEEEAKVAAEAAQKAAQEAKTDGLDLSTAIVNLFSQLIEKVAVPSVASEPRIELKSEPEVEAPVTDAEELKALRRQLALEKAEKERLAKELEAKTKEEAEPLLKTIDDVDQYMTDEVKKPKAKKNGRKRLGRQAPMEGTAE